MKVEFTAKQRTLVEALQTRRYRYFLFGGGAGGGKTVLGALIMLNYALLYGGSNVGVFRREMPALKDTTYRTFCEVAENMGLREGVHFRIHRKDMNWEFNNGSTIFFNDLSDKVDPDFNRVKGLELSCGFIDEANEVVEAAFQILRTRIGRKNQHGGHAFIYMTCNPDQNWVKTLFYDPWKREELEPEFYYLQSLARDNPHLPDSYIEQFNTMPDAYRERFGNGNWDYGNEDTTLFKMRYLLNCLVETPNLTGQRRMGVDVAREGDDETVISLIDGNTLVDLMLPKISKNTNDPIGVLTANFVEEYASKHNVSMSEVQIDTVGVGATVFDVLRSRGHAVRQFKSGYSAPDPLTYGNLRDQAYYELSQAIELGEFKIWNGIRRWESLRQDLVNHSLIVTDKLIRVEPKAMVKKRTKRSPDDSDALVMAWWRSKKQGVYVPKRPRLPRMMF